MRVKPALRVWSCVLFRRLSYNNAMGPRGVLLPFLSPQATQMLSQSWSQPSRIPDDLLQIPPAVLALLFSMEQLIDVHTRLLSLSLPKVIRIYVTLRVCCFGYHFFLGIKFTQNIRFAVFLAGWMPKRFCRAVVGQSCWTSLDASKAASRWYTCG